LAYYTALHSLDTKRRGVQMSKAADVEIIYGIVTEG